jgi:hypothetical protein
MSEILYHSLLSWNRVAIGSTPTLGQVDGDIFGGFTTELGAFLPSLLGAIVILVIGIIVAYIARAIVKGVLNRTDIDNKIAGWIAGSEGGQLPKVEEWIAGGVFWIIIILAIVAALQSLQLTAVTEPLNNFLEGVIGFIPNIVGALIWIVIAWVVATIVKLVVTRALHAAGLDEKLSQQMREDEQVDSSTANTTAGVQPPGSTQTTSGATPSTSNNSNDWNNNFSISKTVGNALYWFIWLLFLPPILGTLQLDATLEPVLVLLNEILAILPNILGAVIIAAVGWLVAQVVRRVVTNLLIAAGTDRVGQKIGLSGATRSQSLSWLIGTTVFVLILIPVAIASLNALEIAAIAAPAVEMLEQILNLLPKLFAATVVLIVAYIIGKYVAELVTSILEGAGFNNVFQWLGIPSGRTTPTPAPERPTPEIGQETTVQPRRSSVQVRTPSETVGIILWVGIMLFATLAAVEIVDIPAVTTLVEGIILISGRILAGVIVFAIGLYLANLAFNFISSSSRQSRILAHSARIAIIALVTAMALEQIGIATDIVNLAFGLLLGAIAIAIALAFGLGSRDIAAQQVREWLDSFKS